MPGILASFMGSAAPRTRLPRTASRRRAFFQVEAMEDRTLMATSPIRIGTLGDSLTDEYAFYAPDRTAAQNWVQILSGLRSSQVSFGVYTTDSRGETRNQGYAQNWARSGATAVGPDVAGANTTLVQQYNGNSQTGSPGLLTQPGGLSNVDVVTILIGGNDYEARLAQLFNYTITSSDVGSSLTTVLGSQAFNKLLQIEFDVIEGIDLAVQAIRAQNPNMPIVLISTPDVGDTPLVIDANAALNSFLPSSSQNLLLNAFHSVADSITSNLKSFASQNNLGFVDLDNLFGSFVANPVVNGVYIDPLTGGPEYTDMFVGDDFHPGTVAQSILANAIIAQLNTIFPGAITPLSNSEILAYAQAIQPVTQATLTSSAESASPNAPVTFIFTVSNFPNINSSTTSTNFSSIPLSGTVSFYDVSQGNKLLAVTNLIPIAKNGAFTEGIATLTTTTLGTGSHEIIAVYSGNSVYPAASTSSVVVNVGTPSQTQLFSFVRTYQTQLGVQITEPQLQQWTRLLNRGAAPQRVARSIMSFVYRTTNLSRRQATAVLREAGLVGANLSRDRKRSH